MKVLLVNGSARKDRNTYTALKIVSDVLNEEGIETEIFQIKNKQYGCLHCHYCHTKGHGKCIFDDDGVNEIASRLNEFDGFVFGAPIYSGGPSGTLKAFLDRLHFVNLAGFAYKAGAVVVTGRRGCLSESYNDLIRSMTGNGHMYLIGSSTFGHVHGSGSIKEEVYKDEEGLQNMRTLGKNMAYFLKMKKLGEKAGIVPLNLPEKIYTDFGKDSSYYR